MNKEITLAQFIVLVIVSLFAGFLIHAAFYWQAKPIEHVTQQQLAAMLQPETHNVYLDVFKTLR